MAVEKGVRKEQIGGVPQQRVGLLALLRQRAARG
jgi:hypothetical protein